MHYQQTLGSGETATHSTSKRTLRLRGAGRRRERTRTQKLLILMDSNINWVNLDPSNSQTDRDRETDRQTDAHRQTDERGRRERERDRYIVRQNRDITSQPGRRTERETEKISVLSTRLKWRAHDKWNVQLRHFQKTTDCYEDGRHHRRQTTGF